MWQIKATSFKKVQLKTCAFGYQLLKDSNKKFSIISHGTQSTVVVKSLWCYILSQFIGIPSITTLFQARKAHSTPTPIDFQRKRWLKRAMQIIFSVCITAAATFFLGVG
jgi:hypothetical protein